MKRRLMLILMAALMVICSVSNTAFAAYQATSLRHGMRGDAVKEIQEALITLGYLKGPADGVFGNKTENAVRAFQKKNKLNVDGVVGPKTKALLLSQANGSGKEGNENKNENENGNENNGSSKKLFGGDYSTIRFGAKGARVKNLQKALIGMKYLSGSADGKFGNKTLESVKSFQSNHKLTADGVAGKKTLMAIETAVENNEKAPSGNDPTPSPTPSPTPTPAPDNGDDEDLNDKISPPAKSEIKLLKWYDQVKPDLRSKQKLLIYEPSSGLSWTLSIYACGHHCDAEPLTSKDTRTMIKAFGGVKTWNQKGVYVRLPDGRWTVGSTHDNPHDASSIKDNDFNGHLCVHFLRPMEEAKKNDPNYGVSNQETIRTFWKNLTGEEIDY